MDMEFCPHGARIVCAVGETVRFLDDCNDCQELLADLGFQSRVVQRETIYAA